MRVKHWLQLSGFWCISLFLYTQTFLWVTENGLIKRKHAECSSYLGGNTNDRCQRGIDMRIGPALKIQNVYIILCLNSTQSWRKCTPTDLPLGNTEAKVFFFFLNLMYSVTQLTGKTHLVHILITQNDVLKLIFLSISCWQLKLD